MISPRAVALILSSEGLDQPGRWPGESSGITLGHGYDLGYCSASEFARDWAPQHLSEDHLDRLRVAIGKKGLEAKAIAGRFRDIKISREAAIAVFETATLPKYTAQTRLAFPGVELLPPDAFGALTSIVFNRGASMTGDRRREMAAIRGAIGVFKDDPENVRAEMLPELLQCIASEVRSMKRLWIGQGVDGLLARRDAEAALIESAAHA